MLAEIPNATMRVWDKNMLVSKNAKICITPNAKLKICVTPNAKLKICVTPNANPERESVEYRIFLRWPCTFNFVFLGSRFPVEYGLKTQ